MPELKKFKKLYKPLTPEQRQKTVDSAITKRIAQFEKMDQKHYRKLTKAAKEAKEFELKKLRRRLKALEQSDTAQEAEQKGTKDLIKVAEMEKADKLEIEEELKMSQKINPEVVVTLAFKKLHADLEKITKKERVRLAKEALKRQAEEASLANDIQRTAGLEVLPEPPQIKPEPVQIKRERPDESADVPKAKKSKKNKSAEAEPSTSAPEVKQEEPEVKIETDEAVKLYGQQLGVSKWAQNKIEANTTLKTWEDAGPFRTFAEKVMKHAHFNDAFLQVKKIQLQQKAKLEKFKVLCIKHQLLAEQKALENGLNPPPPKPKKGKKGQQKKRVFKPMTEEERKAAKKFKYDKNKDRNMERKREAQQAKAALETARAQKLQNALKLAQASGAQV